MHYPPGKNFDTEKKCSSAYAFVCTLQALIQWELGTIENCERENILIGAQHGNDRARVPRHDFITVNFLLSESLKHASHTSAVYRLI